MQSVQSWLPHLKPAESISMFTLYYGLTKVGSDGAYITFIILVVSRLLERGNKTKNFIYEYILNQVKLTFYLLAVISLVEQNIF